MKKVAIFDIDGTVFRSSLFIDLVDGLIEDGLFHKSLSKEYERQFTSWLHRKGSYDEYIDAVVKAFMSNLQGIHYKDFTKVAEKVIESEQQKLYTYTRDLIEDLKKRGYYLLAISQSPKTILEGFCKGIGFDKVYGRLYELNSQDRFTGNVIELHLIANKANIVKRAVEKEKLTLEDSVGVGDTDGDVSFLEMVDNPICFNPNKKLFKHAKRLGWKIVVERKDVVYEI